MQTFVSWFSDPLLAHLRLWLKTKVERWFTFILLAPVFHRRLSWKHGSLRFFEDRETDQRVFFLQSICSVNNRHLQTTNGSTLTLYLSFKGQRKYAARLSPFRGTTAMPCRNSCPWLPNPWYKCAHAWGAGQAVGLKSWVKPWAPGLFVFQKSSLSSLRGAHLCEFGKILVAELPSPEEKWWKVTLPWRHHRQNFRRTRTNESICRRGVTLYCKPFYYIKPL